VNRVLLEVVVTIQFVLYEVVASGVLAVIQAAQLGLHTSQGAKRSSYSNIGTA
jgi:hypothetical protein